MCHLADGYQRKRKYLYPSAMSLFGIIFNACIMKPALACPFSSRFICIMPFRHHLETLRLIAPDTPARGQRNNHGHDPLMQPMARDGFTVKPEWFHQEAL
ncbi:hypothetical protein ACU81Q_03915 [Komagataeibacter melomenusus]